MYIAHKRKSDGFEQSVKEHCDAVAGFAAKWGEAAGMTALCRLCGKLHDMGKESDEFLEYILYSFDNPLDGTRRGSVDHGHAGGKYIFENFHMDGTTIDKITAEIAAMVVCFHHGGLSDYVNLDCYSPLLERLEKQAKEHGYKIIKANFLNDCYSECELKEDFLEARSEVERFLRKSKQLKLNLFGVAMLTKFIYSCIIDADRLDSYLFSEGGTEKTAGCTSLWEKLSARMENFVAGLKRKNDIDDLRSGISDICRSFAICGTGIYSLTVPTGGGKTYSGFRYAVEHARLQKKERIIYIAPYTTIIDQNAGQIKSIFKCDELILEHHSNIIKDNDNEDFKLMTERWDSPIIFTTMVQFLNTIFEGGSQSVRRMHHLANAVIIFDEIQTLPITCVHLFNNALNFLAQICNTTCILCTATQPALTETKHPIILSEDGEMIKDLTETFRAFKRVEVIDKRVLGGYSISQLANLIFEQGENVKSILCILNTKKTAQAVYKEILGKNADLPDEERWIICHLSTNMCQRHRIKSLEDLKLALDQADKGGRKVICISTQLIEAGIDISFECVFRCIAGLDSIVQAAGRCNRHGGPIIRKVFIINLEHENLSSLPEIQQGADCAKRLLEDFKKNPQLYDNDIISPKSMERYYRHYYKALEQKMKFPIKGTDTSIYDLLDRNEVGVTAYCNKYGEDVKLCLRQAYKTAGENFFVIPDNTTAVIVPYEDGEMLIADLNGICDLTKLSRLLKKAQQYSVNLFSQQLEELRRNNAVDTLKNGDILAIKPQFYDNDLGVVAGGKIMGFLDI